MGLATAGAHGFPFGLDFGGNLKRSAFPAVGILGRLQLGLVGQSAVTFGRILRGMAVSDVGLAGDHRRAVGFLGRRQGAIDIFGIMAVAFQHVPSRSCKARLLIGGIRKRHFAVDGNAVVIPQHDQAVQLVLARDADGLLADALHQAAVADNDVGVMVLHLGTPAGAQMRLCHGKANRVGDALTQGAGGGFNASHMAKLGVACGDGAPLAEVLDLVQRDVFVARQVQQRIDQHRAMAS